MFGFFGKAGEDRRYVWNLGRHESGERRIIYVRSTGFGKQCWSDCSKCEFGVARRDDWKALQTRGTEGFRGAGRLRPSSYNFSLSPNCICRGSLAAVARPNASGAGRACSPRVVGELKICTIEDVEAFDHQFHRRTFGNLEHHWRNGRPPRTRSPDCAVTPATPWQNPRDSSNA